MKCIFCGKNEEQLNEENYFTLEHIIPKSLGNNVLTLNCVCKECNSNLGEYVDNYFVDNMIVKIPRQILGLKGQSGKIPNAFKDGIDEYGNKVKVSHDFKPTIMPKVVVEENNGCQNIKIIAPDKDIAKNIIKKTLGRKNISYDKIQEMLNKVELVPVYSYMPKINYNFKIELNRFYLEALKIAYEYMIFIAGDIYLKDVCGRKIQNILNKAISGEYEKTCPYIENVCMMPSEVYEIFSKVLPENSHFLMIHKIPDNKLVVEISIFLQKAFSFSIIVSNNAEQYGCEDIRFIEPVKKFYNN